MFWAKQFKTGKELVVAICDQELLSQRFATLEIKPEFYAGKLVDEAEALKMMEGATIINLLGRRAVELAVRAGHVTQEHVLEVNGILHAQAIKL